MRDGHVRAPRAPERKLGPDGFEAWMRALLLTHELTRTQKIVALVIATRDWYGMGEGCTLAVPNIALAAGSAEGTVKRALRRLKAVGLVTSERRFDAKGAQTSSSLRIDRVRCMSLASLPGVAVAPGVGSAPPQGPNGTHGQGSMLASWGDTHRPTKPMQTNTEPNKPTHGKVSASPMRDPVRQWLSPGGAVETVFAHWRDTMRRDPSRTRLTDSRRSVIINRLRENGGVAEELMRAIDGARYDEWLMGEAERSTRRYDELETVLRDRSQVERLCRVLEEDMQMRRTLNSQLGSLQGLRAGR